MKIHKYIEKSNAKIQKNSKFRSKKEENFHGEVKKQNFHGEVKKQNFHVK